MEGSRKILVKSTNPVEFFGVNNTNLKYLKKYFPQLKIASRGNTLTLSGEDDIIDHFEHKIALLLKHLEKYNSLSENNIDNLMLDDGASLIGGRQSSDVILHGNGGNKIRARTVNQKKLVDSIEKHDMVFAVGPAGTGKTYTAVALAVKALKVKEVRRIVLTRPAVEAGENLGFLPGDLKEKLDPYLMPLYDALREMIPAEKLAEMLEHGVIEIAPLAFMRGRTLDKAFVILDEGQNTTTMQMKMFLTRMGTTAKFIITGDMSQIDLPSRQKSGLSFALDTLKEVKEIGIIRLGQIDVVRNKLVTKIIEAYEKYDIKNKE
ncbi:MAG: phosphate starvation-inducible protein PhoH [Cryomorphaceae bacterium]|nr:phosphate starvation-inducible protein PhoH [Cryomorphaceae bacterium]